MQPQRTISTELPLTPAMLAESSWLATRVRHVAVAIASDEGPLTVYGHRCTSRAAADKARRALANHLVALEQRYCANPHCLGTPYPVRLDPFAGALTAGSHCFTIRPVRCAACNDLLPRGSHVIPVKGGVLGTEPQHSCMAPEKRAALLRGKSVEQL